MHTTTISTTVSNISLATTTSTVNTYTAPSNSTITMKLDLVMSLFTVYVVIHSMMIIKRVHFGY